MTRRDPMPEDLLKRVTANSHRADRNSSPVVGTLLSEYEPERTEFLWDGRIPLGKITDVQGDPGLGKSAAMSDFVARVTVGRTWPDGAPCKKGGAVILSAEDGAADTIRPRLDAAGGDPSRVLDLSTVPDGDGERLISIPEDLDVIRRGVERVGAVIVVIDPFTAFLSGRHNAHKDQDVRRALAPLARLAQDTGAAVVMVRHLNKAAGGNALYRGGGSIGIVGASRAAFLVAKHPEDEDGRVLAPLKSNLARPAPSLAFKLVGVPNGAVRVEYQGATGHAADALLAAPADPEDRSALGEAMEFLRDILGDGPVWSKEIKKEARAADISEITLKRAKGALGVRSEKQGDGSWSWALPPRKGNEGDQGVPFPKDDPDDSLDSLPANKPDVVMQGDQDDQGDQGHQAGSEDLPPDDDVFEI